MSKDHEAIIGRAVAEIAAKYPSLQDFFKFANQSKPNNMTTSEIINAIDVLTRAHQLCHNSNIVSEKAEQKLAELIAMIPATSDLPSVNPLVGIHKNQLTESDLISFGNYLLSEERAERIAESEKPEQFANVVTQGDIDAWKEKTTV